MYMYVADIDFASVSAIFYFILELFWLEYFSYSLKNKYKNTSLHKCMQNAVCYISKSNNNVTLYAY